MNGYICYHKRQRVEVEADSTLHAREKAAALLKVSKARRHMITAVLVEKDGDVVKVDPASIG